MRWNDFSPSRPENGLTGAVVFPILLLAAAVCVAQTPPVRLTLQQAEAMAMQNHPEVLAAQDTVAAMGQQVVQARAPYYPVVAGDATGSGANIGARIGAGNLTTSRLFNRFGTGLNIQQLVTDSGRTPNLVAAARLHQTASQQTYQATRFDVLLAVNRAYFDVLRAQATIKVAQETVAARQTIVDQVTALANNKLRSMLDVSFVDVNLSEAKLLLLQAQDEQQEAFAELTRAMGSQQNAVYTLTDEPLPPGPPAGPEALVTEAIAARPELASLRSEREAAYRFERAERDLSYPTVSFIGLGGYIPYIDQITLPRVIPSEYAGAAVDVHVPIFNGHLFSARREEAHYRALESDQRLRNEEESIVRDVRTAWAAASTAFQRLDVTAELLRQATLALSLAQGRYDLGLASIVELTQAQLSLTQAEIENLNAKYDYQSQNAALQYTVGSLR
ncbi:MAG TPA: TolC family protein [Bryobacteraceae bacterium]|nr:TolC family protein [Bryobacteraceae bacterium]